MRLTGGRQNIYKTYILGAMYILFILSILSILSILYVAAWHEARAKQIGPGPYSLKYTKKI
jgi:hypothetical protein